MIITAIATILMGIIYGYTLYTGKMYTFYHQKPMLDLLLTVMRYIVLFGILFYLTLNMSGNSILLIILFVSSYLSTVGILVYKK